jgi:hypothetical protein
MVLGCTDTSGKDNAGTVSGADTGSDSDGWWEEPGGEEEGDDEGDDDDDDDDDGGDDDEGVEYDGFVDLNAGSGMFDLRLYGCTISGTFVDVVALESCSDCSFAMSMTVDSVSIDAGEDCDYFLAWEGETESFGQGTGEVGEFCGSTYYNLYEFEEGEGWVEVEDGYSTATDSTWSFGVKQ